MADVNAPLIVDLDTGGGVEPVTGVNLRRSASGGSQEMLGETTMALSLPVVIANDQTAIDVSAATVTVDTELLAVAALADTTANPTVTSVGTFLHLFNGTTWDRAVGATATGMEVDIVQSVSLTVSGAVTTEFAGTTALATMADADANPDALPVASYQMGFNGTTWDRVRVANTGRLQVDVITGGGSDSPTNPVIDGTNATTPVNVAAGSEGDITTVAADDKKLVLMTIWSSVAFRARVYTVDNAVESTDPVAVGGASAHNSWEFRPTHRSYVTVGNTAGLDAFRVEVKNLDDSLAADFYMVAHYED